MTYESPDAQRNEMAARLREAREYLGMSQEEVANALGVSRPAISNIESGVRKIEAVELDQLARLYGRSVGYFLSGEDPGDGEKVAFFARTLKDLSQKDLNEVARFADFLRAGANRKNTPRSKG